MRWFIRPRGSALPGRGVDSVAMDTRTAASFSVPKADRELNMAGRRFTVSMTRNDNCLHYFWSIQLILHVSWRGVAVVFTFDIVLAGRRIIIERRNRAQVSRITMLILLTFDIVRDCHFRQWGPSQLADGNREQSICLTGSEWKDGIEWSRRTIWYRASVTKLQSREIVIYKFNEEKNFSSFISIWEGSLLGVCKFDYREVWRSEVLHCWPGSCPSEPERPTERAGVECSHGDNMIMMMMMTGWRWWSRDDLLRWWRQNANDGFAVTIFARFNWSFTGFDWGGIYGCVLDRDIVLPNRWMIIDRWNMTQTWDTTLVIFIDFWHCSNNEPTASCQRATDLLDWFFW